MEIAIVALCIPAALVIHKCVTRPIVRWLGWA